MTDRELLELAARAAGIDAYWINENVGMWHRIGHFGGWNPLRDDGDALRLAVKLKLWVSPTMDGELVEVSAMDDAVFVAEVAIGRDPYAATRRAVVRAAAALATKETP